MRVISGSARGTKLHSIEELTTRPTLDRVKESLFNIIANDIDGTIGLDLFAGSGAIGIELLSRGANKVYFNDTNIKCIEMIKRNLNSTHLLDKAVISKVEYKDILKKFNKDNVKFDIIYIDPPYKSNYGVDAIKLIKEYKLLQENGLLILETDEEERDKKQILEIEEDSFKIFDSRKYGRAHLLFLGDRDRKGKM